jgi:hypothetical protein
MANLLHQIFPRCLALVLLWLDALFVIWIVLLEWHYVFHLPGGGAVAGLANRDERSCLVESN